MVENDFDFQQDSLSSEPERKTNERKKNGNIFTMNETKRKREKTHTQK